MTRLASLRSPLRFEASSALGRPLWWIAVLVLALNDHVLKGSGLVPAVVTGKLSDAAGMLVFPVLLAVIVRARSLPSLALCHALTLGVFGAIKLSAGIAAWSVLAASWVGESWSIVADPSDLLVAVPALAASWQWLVRPALRAPATGRRGPLPALGVREIVLVGLGALACGASSRTPPQVPAIDAGRVVAGPWGVDETYVIDPQDGHAIRHLGTGSGDPPVIFDGALWSTREDDKGTTVVAFDLGTGKARPALQLPQATRGTVGAVDEAFVYVKGYACGDPPCDWPATWTAVDRSSSLARWTIHTHPGARILARDGIAATTEGPRLIVRDIAGVVLHTRTFAARANVLALFEGTLWVGDATGLVVALDARTGRPSGRWELGEAAGRIAPEYVDWRLNPAGAFADRLFVVVGDRVVVLRIGAPKPIWERPGGHVAITSGVAIVQTAEGKMSGYDALSGSVLWSSDRGGWGRFAASDGIVAIREGDARVSMFDARTGRPLSAFALDEGKPAPLR